jgi:hypothetical protein
MYIDELKKRIEQLENEGNMKKKTRAKMQRLDDAELREHIDHISKKINLVLEHIRARNLSEFSCHFTDKGEWTLELQVSDDVKAYNVIDEAATEEQCETILLPVTRTIFAVCSSIAQNRCTPAVISFERNKLPSTAAELHDVGLSFNECEILWAKVPYGTEIANISLARCPRDRDQFFPTIITKESLS